MRTVSLKLSLIMLVLAAASVAPLSGIAKNQNKNSAAETAIVGYISQLARLLSLGKGVDVGSLD